MALIQTLHLIQRSPFTHSALSDCLKVIDPLDSILLMQDGVYGLQHPKLLNSDRNLNTNALLDDVLARGLDQLSPETTNINKISYSQFVTLCANHKHVISWY
mgnify:CR=1 FL=1